MEQQQTTQPVQQPTKFCKFCGAAIPVDAVLCTHCGRQVEVIQQAQAQQPQVVINNSNSNVNTNTNINAGRGYGRPKNKWVSFFLCLFTVCGHKFYEGKIGMGILYFFTAGFFLIGWLIDLISLLFKPNPYYV